MLDKLIKSYGASLKASEINKFYTINADEYTKSLIDEKVKRERVILEALKKQAPKRIVKIYHSEITDYCPICYSRVFEKENYCSECGQNLRWED